MQSEFYILLVHFPLLCLIVVELSSYCGVICLQVLVKNIFFPAFTSCRLEIFFVVEQYIYQKCNAFKASNVEDSCYGNKISGLEKEGKPQKTQYFIFLFQYDPYLT